MLGVTGKGYVESRHNMKTTAGQLTRNIDYENNQDTIRDWEVHVIGS